MKKIRQLKIGLDFHGVITDNPAYFKELANLAIAKGYEIHVISGGPQLTIIEFLNKWEIKYTAVFAIVDFYDAQGQVSFFENGEFKVRDSLWNRAKAEYCERNKIDLHIDDTARYSQGFKTPFCFYNPESRLCRINNETIVNLGINPKDALTEIENFVTKMRH